MLFFEGLKAGLLVTQFKENKDLEYIQGIIFHHWILILDVVTAPVHSYNVVLLCAWQVRLGTFNSQPHRIQVTYFKGL